MTYTYLHGSLIRSGTIPASAMQSSESFTASFAVTSSYAMNGGGGSVPAGTVSSSIQYLSFLEERPTVPSPYDDEFDALPNTASLWTRSPAGITGTLQPQAGQLIVSCAYSRLLVANSLNSGSGYIQSMSLTHPLRIRLGVEGAGSGSYGGVQLLLLGTNALGGLGLNLDHDSPIGPSARRVTVQKFTLSGSYNSDLQTTIIANNGSVASQQMYTQEMIMMVDATNVTLYTGPPHSPSLIYQYARSNMGQLWAFGYVMGLGMSVKWFRVDRATQPYDFPKDWAG